MSGSSSPSTSSAPTIYQLSSLPPPSTLSDVAIDSDLLKPPGKEKKNSLVILVQLKFCGFSQSWRSLTEYLGRYEAVIKILTIWVFFCPPGEQIMVDKSVSVWCWQIPTIYADLLCCVRFLAPDEWRKLTEFSSADRNGGKHFSGAKPSSRSDDKFLLLN